ncbi:hypothetical protein VTN02DRAFT_6713, partial [Thermoascus thermophilus]
LEELKGQVREAERALRRAEEDKAELEHSQKEWRWKRDELAAQAERSLQELQDVRQAMAQLRDALDESEKQVRALEKERAELRRSVEEMTSRAEKLRKANRSLAEGINKKDSPSSRSSVDSGPAERQPASISRSATPTAPSIDYIYLKNVLLQFLEQKDKNHQKQLIPVLGMLLHFDGTDEQRWMSAIMSR